MTLRGFRLLQDHWTIRHREKYARTFQVINYITAAFGRQGELKPGSVFPILEDLDRALENDEDDIDPRAAFETISGSLIR